MKQSEHPTPEGQEPWAAHLINLDAEWREAVKAMDYEEQLFRDGRTSNDAANAKVHDAIQKREVLQSALWADWEKIKAALSAFSEKGDMVLVPRSFLEATPCPNCDGSGSIISTGPDPMNEPCQWCEEKHLILSGAERA